MVKQAMAVYYLDIVIDTQEHIPIQFRIALDETTRNKLMKLHPVGTRLIHTVDPCKFQGIQLPPAALPAAPPVDLLDRFKMNDG